MARTGIIHHFGTFLLLVATILLIITDISAPVVNHISILRVELDGTSGSNHPEISFGTFGYCVLNATPGVDRCSKRSVGYDATEVVEDNSNVDFNDASAKSTNALTRVMILHPVATALSFISFLLAIGAGIVGSLLASLVSFLTFIVTLVVLITDFIAFGLVKANVNNANDDSSAMFGAAIWTLLAALVCNFLATIIIFFTCCSARLHRRRESKKVETDYAGTTPARRRWF